MLVLMMFAALFGGVDDVRGEVFVATAAASKPAIVKVIITDDTDAAEGRYKGVTDPGGLVLVDVPGPYDMEVGQTIWVVL